MALDLNSAYSITVGQPNGGTSSGFGIWARGGNNGSGYHGGGGYGICSEAKDGANGGTFSQGGQSGGVS